MGIDLILVGKTDSAEIAALMADYSKRISRYARFTVVFLPDVRNAGKLPVQIQKQAEGEMILRQTAPGDYVVLLDEKGTEMRSVEFAAWLGGKLTGSARRICFIVGGPYGFSGEVYARADAMLSLSRMTFSHQLVRTLFTEQLGFFKAVAPKKSTFIIKQIMCQLPFCRYKSMMTVSRTADRSVTRYIPA